MKHLTVESKDLLIGDEAADLLTQYAAVVADHGLGDRVLLHALSSDGDAVEVMVVLSAGTTIIAETSHNTFPEPDNGESIAYLRKRIKEVTSPPPVQPADLSSFEGEFDEL
jgi:hypothetical protein